MVVGRLYAFFFGIRPIFRGKLAGFVSGPLPDANKLQQPSLFFVKISAGSHLFFLKLQVVQKLPLFYSETGLTWEEVFWNFTTGGLYANFRSDLLELFHMDVSKNRGIPKMDGENNGKPHEQMDELVVFPYFLETPNIQMVVHSN